MTDFRIEHLAFETENVSTWRLADPKYSNWPVVYIISNEKEIYVGETVNAGSRMLQH